MQFVAVGDAFVDVVCDSIPQPGERRHGEVDLRAGGSAVNAALAAARLGAEASVIGRVGNDAAGELVAATLEAGGVGALLARDAEVATGVAVALADAVVADRGANARLSPNDVPDPLEADVLLVSGFALFQQGSAEAAQAGLQRFSGQWAAVDLASPRLAARADLGAVSADANVVFATAEEAKAVTGAEPEEAARALASQFAVACVKLGEHGAVAARESHLERAAAAPVAQQAPFGAGDAFAAAFLIALAGGDTLRSALEQACDAGAHAAASL